MTRGLILGKFAPLHRGHQLLIERSLAQCDETVVLVYESREVTRVPLNVRAGWIRMLYPRVTVIEGTNCPAATGRDPATMRLQEEYIASVVPRPITHFFSSEWYGAHVSASLGAIDVRVDEARKAMPVSGTMIRTNPAAFQNWVDPMVYADLVRWDRPAG
jgi:HTH-type transcriptional regulator, transcriptional repressor of NAD biosynthesis genes